MLRYFIVSLFCSSIVAGKYVGSKNSRKYLQEMSGYSEDESVSLVEGNRSVKGTEKGSDSSGDEGGSFKNESFITFPFLVFIETHKFHINYNFNKHKFDTHTEIGICGGSIIREDVILTAAHCLKDRNAKEVTIFAGIANFNEPKESHQTVGAVRLIKHERYNYSTPGWEFDIALVFLEHKLNFTDYVKPINLPNENDYWVGETTTAVGWGRSISNGAMENRLHKVDYEIKPNSFCEIFTKTSISWKEICAIDPKYKLKVCRGDSGGPLFSDNVILGISSSVLENKYSNLSNFCDPKLPAIFAKVYAYMDWINKHLKAHGSVENAHDIVILANPLTYLLFHLQPYSSWPPENNHQLYGYSFS